MSGQRWVREKIYEAALNDRDPSYHRYQRGALRRAGRKLLGKAPNGSGNWLSHRQRHLGSLRESEDCEGSRHFGEGQMHSVREQKPLNRDNSSLSDVIQLAQRGDVRAFELIYRVHCRRV